VGDIGIVGSARTRARVAGYAPLLAPLLAAQPPLDLAFANLEFPVAEPGWMLKGRTQEFWHEPGVATGLAGAGFQVVSLANNHMMDASERGLRCTLEACRAAGLRTVGAGMTLAEAREPARLTIRDQRVVVLGYASAGKSDQAGNEVAGVAPLDLELVREDVARWRSEADLLVLSVHWGSMYVDSPPARVVRMGEELTRMGADLVLGHHPHVLQGFRREAGHLTLFSLGDAAFNAGSGDLDVKWTREGRRHSGLFVALVADEPGREFHGVELDADGLPAQADEAYTLRAGQRLAELSTDWERPEQRFREEGAPRLMNYELAALGQYLKTGRIDRAVKLLASVRPRHFSILLDALRSRLR
jgi:poly-gamma-glutamate synthesis protein (capsule biosynthesis protein)